MSDDVVFEKKGRALADEIYGTTKGVVRLEVTWRTLMATVPVTSRPAALRVIDVGAGHGHLAARLAAAGHHLTLVEPAGDLLDEASERVHAAGHLEAAFDVPVQSLPSALEPFDLVVCHAVVEWVHDPGDLIRRLAALVKPDGWVSILAYNPDRALFNQIIRGRLLGRLVLGDVDSRQSDRLSGARPVSFDSLQEMLDAAGLTIRSVAGVRIFHDLLDPSLLADPARINELIDLETEMSQIDPFRRLGHHLHIVARRADTDH